MRTNKLIYSHINFCNFSKIVILRGKVLKLEKNVCKMFGILPFCCTFAK